MTRLENDTSLYYVSWSIITGAKFNGIDGEEA
jgi:hypothetical protein